MSQHAPQHPADYRVVTPQEMTDDPFSPYHRLGWIWVYSADLLRPESSWVTMGTGTFIEEDVVVTCAHIFAQRGSVANVNHVVVAPGHNTQHRDMHGNRPVGGLNAKRVVICGKAMPPGRRQGEFDMEWDFALIFLARPPQLPMPGRRFLLHEEFMLYGGQIGYDPSFSGNDSTLKLAGYGGAPDGVLTWARAPIERVDDIQVERHWLRVRCQMQPGHSGGPIFYKGQDERRNDEYRLVGVCSADDRTDRRYTLGPIITNETMAWFNRAMAYGRQEGERKIELFD